MFTPCRLLLRLAVFGVVAVLFALPRAITDAQEFNPAQLRQLEALERRILYHPRKYEPADVKRFEEQGGQRIAYETVDGKQFAWLLPPADKARLNKLWVICGGNGSLALDLVPFSQSLSFADDAFLFVDYPGYGQCDGSPSPEGIRRNVTTSIRSAIRELGHDEEKIDDCVCLFGHSLGCAAALLAVDELKLKKGVFLAPFTSTRAMAEATFALHKSIPLKHDFDNRAGLAALARLGGRAWILHGKQDEIIPVKMGAALHKEFPKTVTFTAVEGAHHNDILQRAFQTIKTAMSEARK